MRPDFVHVGRVRSAHGLRGEVLVESLSDLPGRLESLERFRLELRSGQVREYRVRGRRPHKGGQLVLLEGVEDRDAAELIRGSLVTIPSGELPDLPDDTFFVFDLIGAEVATESGELLGKLKEIWAVGGNDVLVVRGGERGEILLPSSREVVRSVDVKERRIKVHLIPGLLD